MQSNSALVGPTYVLITISTLILQLAIYDRQGLVLHEWVQLASVIGLGIAIRFSDTWTDKKAGKIVAALGFALIAALPFVADIAQRAYSPYGNPFEVQLILCLRNLMIGLGVRNRDARGLIFASLVSGFLTLFSLLWLMNRWTISLMFIYAVIGMWWLIGAYWDRLSGCFISRSERRIPWIPVSAAVMIGMVALLVSLPLATGKNYTTAIQGLFPSSGGTGGQDEFAFGGVGDGPQMVSAKDNASSFGPIESELFLESKMPSLYDVMNEFSNPPPRLKKRKRLRSIPLAPSQMQQNHKRKGMNKQAGREFSAVRKTKQETPSVKDLNSYALLQVIGRVPIHLGLHAYDTWDGHKLSSSQDAQELSLKLELNEKNENWLTVGGSTPIESLTYQDQHELRITNLKTDRVPAVPNLASVHIDKLHTETLFLTAPDGMLAMPMEHIPQLTIFHVKSRQRRPSQVPQLAQQNYLTVGNDDKLAALAKNWTMGVNSGWPEVKAICDRLSQDYTLEPNAMVPEETDDAAEYFLMEAKRGPDYLFATSAALLLRTLGYETRVISGFYADPKNYDRKSKITSVFAEDAHFWIEVLATPTSIDSEEALSEDVNYWIAIDPTPGYEVLLAPESFWTQLFARAALTWHALKRNPVRALAVVVMFAVVWRWKSYLLDFCITAWWLVIHRWGDARHRVKSTILLLERRARVHGFPRAKGESLSKWSQTAVSKHPTTMNWRVAFFELANWALYGEDIPSSYSRQEVNKLCKQAVAIKIQTPKLPSDGSTFINRRSA